ncbi:MAG: cbb3-type cytochrome c oxidase N-terminal domain-containing protein [Verrucomicrobiales bacterium]|jgi:cytochrome c oxidase cbb3-type subunit 3|nr:cbb3-type cytochrome c oxidase N-terminal domain-containing protein [Verrucomicrobiales bacterium]
MKTKDPNNNEVILKEHVYDGIQEYDQKLPNWWLFTLYITIVWFVFAWVAYYQLPFKMPDSQEKIDAQMALIENKKQEELETMMASINNDSLKEMSLDSSHTDAGKAIFEAKCIACHGQDLSATMNGIQLPGVALNDAEWKYGAEPLNIMEIVTNGSPDITKGMIAWNTQLSPAEIAQVVAYILSKQS